MQPDTVASVWFVMTGCTMCAASYSIQGGVTPIQPIQTFPTGGFDRPLTPNLGVWSRFPMANTFVDQGQSKFEAPVKKPRC